MENRKSSVRLQSGGWSLGFLETKMRKKTPPPSSSRRRSATEGHVKKEADEGRGMGEGGSMKLVSSPSKDGEMTSKPNSSSPLVNATKTTRLSFSGNDEVREIPRIGLTRVPPRPTSTLRPSEFAKSHPRQRRRPPPVVAPPIPAFPIEESVFR